MSHTLFTGMQTVDMCIQSHNFVNLQTKVRERTINHVQERTNFALISGELVQTITQDNG